MKKTKLVAYSGMITALSVVLLFIGSISFSLGYVTPVISGYLMIFLIESVSYKSAFITYLSTSLISFLLLNDKETALFYVLFFGYYPIFRVYLSKIQSKLISTVIKLIVFNVSMAIIQLLLVYIFNISFSNIFGTSGVILFALLLNLLFVLYDLTYDKLIIIYNLKLKQKLDRFVK